MRWNKRTALVGLMVLLPLLGLVSYMARRSSVHKQTVTPAGPELGVTTVWQSPPSVSESGARKKEHVDLLAATKPEPKPLPPAIDLAGKDTEPPLTAKVPPPVPDGNITKASASVVPSPAPVPGNPSPLAPPPVAIPSSPIPPPLPLTGGNTAKTSQTEIKSPWSLRLEVVKGRTILTAETASGASFRIDCERLELKAPQGSIQAMGDVKITSKRLEGTSARVTVNLQDDQVILEGRAVLVSRRDGQSMEVQGERLSLRLVNPTAAADDQPAARHLGHGLGFIRRAGSLP